MVFYDTNMFGLKEDSMPMPQEIIHNANALGERIFDDANAIMNIAKCQYLLVLCYFSQQHCVQLYL